MRVCLVQRSDASVNSRSKCVCFSSRDIREMDGCCGNDPRSRRRTLKRNPIRVLESARCCFSSFPPLDFPVGQGKVSAAPRVNRLWNLRLKKRSQITSRSGIHNNKPAIYLPVSGLPPGEATGSQKWLRSINIPFSRGVRNRAHLIVCVCVCVQPVVSVFTFGRV